MGELFDRIMIVDWSAASSPALGANSIWVATSDRKGTVHGPVNIRTRTEVISYIAKACHQALEKHHRLLIGFDFAFGFPAGAAKMFSSRPGWRVLWQMLAEEITDDDQNRNNRFNLAAQLNKRSGFAQGPFWGHPPSHQYDGLDPKKPNPWPGAVPERRLIEHRLPRAKSVWQLAYTGAVGSQSLTGIARLQALINMPEFAGHIAVWPFQTAFAENLSRPITIAEIYPSAFTIKETQAEPLDATQVRTLAKGFAALDRAHRFAPLLAAPADLTISERKQVLTEEGWIVGADHGRNL